MLDNKVPPLIIFCIIATLMWCISMITPVFDFSETTQLVSIILFFLIGVFFSLSGVFAFNKAQTTVDPRTPDKISSLVSTGIYKISRNPMYVGFVFFLLAWSMFLLSPFSFIGIICFIIYLNRFQIEPEERALKEIFGEQYLTYLSTVRRWL